MLSLLPLALLGTYANWDLACSDELKVGGAAVYGATPVDSPFEIAVYSDSDRNQRITEKSEYYRGEIIYVSRPPPPRRAPPRHMSSKPSPPLHPPIPIASPHPCPLARHSPLRAITSSADHRLCVPWRAHSWMWFPVQMNSLARCSIGSQKPAAPPCA